MLAGVFIRVGVLAFCAVVCGMCSRAEAVASVRIKDLAKVQTPQDIQLTGVGLIIGLEGTGDGRKAEFTFQMMANMMHRMKVAVTP